MFGRLAVIAVAVSVLVPSTVASAGPVASGVGHWDVRAHPLPPDGKTRDASSTGVSCASATHCVSIGSYSSNDPSQPTRLYLATVDPTTGQTEAVAAPLPADVDHDGTAGLTSVSCGGVRCVAVGSYDAVGGVIRPLVETQVRDDRWSVMAFPKLTGAADNVACNPQACVLTGYRGSTNSLLIMTRTPTTGWARQQVVLPAGETDPVSALPTCPSEGACTATATAQNGDGTVPVLLYRSGSHWTATNLAIPAGVAPTTLTVGPMACTSTANCVAFGSYDEDPFRGDVKLFAEILHDGVLHAEDVALPPIAQANPGISPGTVSCGGSADPRCVGLAYYGADDPEEGNHGTVLFVVRDGVLSTRPATAYSAALSDVSCFTATSRTDCVAVGDGGAGTTIPVATYRSGGWSIQELSGRPPGIPHSPKDWSGSLSRVSCAAGSCVSGGGWVTLDQGMFPHAEGALLGTVSGVN